MRIQIAVWYGTVGVTIAYIVIHYL